MTTGWDWSQYATGGAAARPDSFTGLDPAFAAALQNLYGAAPPEIRDQLFITSAYRSPEVQARPYESALERYGSEAEARRWVAPPGNSRHNHGLAVDFSYGNDAARAWVHDNAGAHGLHFPMSWENWHIEPIGADGGRVAMDGTGWAPPPGVGVSGAPGANALAGMAPGGDPMANRLAMLEALRPPQLQNSLNEADFMMRPMQNALLPIMGT